MEENLYLILLMYWVVPAMMNYVYYGIVIGCFIMKAYIIVAIIRDVSETVHYMRMMRERNAF